MRMDVRKGEPIKEGADIIGHRTKVKIVKNIIIHMRFPEDRFG